MNNAACGRVEARSGEADAPWVATRHQLNTLNPTWTGEQYTMRLAERAERPFVLQVDVLDKDFKQEDEVLCSGTVQLEELLVGRVTRMALHGHNEDGAGGWTVMYAPAQAVHTVPRDRLRPIWTWDPATLQYAPIKTARR